MPIAWADEHIAATINAAAEIANGFPPAPWLRTAAPSILPALIFLLLQFMDTLFLAASHAVPPG